MHSDSPSLDSRPFAGGLPMRALTVDSLVALPATSRMPMRLASLVPWRREDAAEQKQQWGLVHSCAVLNTQEHAHWAGAANLVARDPIC